MPLIKEKKSKHEKKENNAWFCKNSKCLLIKHDSKNTKKEEKKEQTFNLSRWTLCREETESKWENPFETSTPMLLNSIISTKT